MLSSSVDSPTAIFTRPCWSCDGLISKHLLPNCTSRCLWLKKGHFRSMRTIWYVFCYGNVCAGNLVSYILTQRWECIHFATSSIENTYDAGSAKVQHENEHYLHEWNVISYISKWNLNIVVCYFGWKSGSRSLCNKQNVIMQLMDLSHDISNGIE